MIWRVECCALWSDRTTWPRPNRTPLVFDLPYRINSHQFAHRINLSRFYRALLLPAIFVWGAIAQEVLGRKSLNMVLPSRGLRGQSPQSLKQFADVYRFDCRNDQNPKISHNPSSDSWPVCFTVGGGLMSFSSLAHAWCHPRYGALLKLQPHGKYVSK